MLLVMSVFTMIPGHTIGETSETIQEYYGHLDYEAYTEEDVDVVVDNLDDLHASLTEGITIGVEPGNYVGSIVVEYEHEDVTIVSMEPQGAQLTCMEAFQAIYIEGNGVTIKGFQLMGPFPETSIGIRSFGNDVTITKNHIYEFETSIRLHYGEGVTVYENTLERFKTGVRSDVPAEVNENNIVTAFDFFQANILEHTDAAYSGGDGFDVDYRVVNIGHQEDTQTVTYTVLDDEEQIVLEETEDITLESGGAHDEIYTWDPEGEDPGTYYIRIATEDHVVQTGSLHFDEHSVTFVEENEEDGVQIDIFEDEDRTIYHDTVVTVDGEAHIDFIPDGEYWFTASKFTLSDYHGSFEIDGEDVTVEFEMEDFPGDSVTFTVRDDDDTTDLIEGAEITIMDADDVVAELVTNEIGQAYIDLHPGDYTWIAEHDDYYTTSDTFTAEADESSSIDIDMEAIPDDVNAIFWPFVECTPYQVIEGVTIDIYDDEDMTEHRDTLVTDETGADTMLDDDTTYYYTATIFGWRDEEGSFTTPEDGEEDYHFEYIEMFRQNVIFEVIDEETGDPLPGVELEIFDNVDHEGDAVGTWETLADGRVAFYLDPGDYSLNATLDGYVPTTYHQFTVVEEEVYEDTIELEPDLVEVEFYVHEADDVTAPIEDVDIDIYLEGALAATGQTNSDGQFFVELTDGWEYDFVADKYQWGRVEDDFTAAEGLVIMVPMEEAIGEEVTFNVTWSGISTIPGEEPDIDPGEGVGNATVEIYSDEEREDLVVSGETEWEGEDKGNLTIFLDFLPSGEELYYVIADHPEYEANDTVEFTHYEGGEAEVVEIELDYVAPTYEFEFYVWESTPPGLNPVEGVNITVYTDESRTEQFGESVFTGEDGYAYKDLYEETFYIDATKPGYWDPETEEMTYQAEIEVEPGETNRLQFQMVEFPGFDVTFRALDPDAEPIEGISIDVVDVEHTDLVTDEAGEAVDQFMPDEYAFTAMDTVDPARFETVEGDFEVVDGAIEVEFIMTPIVYEYTVRFWPHDSVGRPSEVLEGVTIVNETEEFGPLVTDENGATAQLEPGMYEFTANRHDYLEKDITFEFEAPEDPDHEVKVIFALDQDDVYEVNFVEVNEVEGVEIKVMPTADPGITYNTVTDEYGEATLWIPEGEYELWATIEGAYGVHEGEFEFASYEAPITYEFEMIIPTAPFTGVRYDGDYEENLDATFNYWAVMNPADVIEDTEFVDYIPWYSEPLPTEDVYNAYVEEFSTITGARTVAVHFTRDVMALDWDPVLEQWYTRALSADDFDVYFAEYGLDVIGVDHHYEAGEGDNLAILELSEPVSLTEFGFAEISISPMVVDDNMLPAWSGYEGILSNEGKLPVTSGWSTVSFPRPTEDLDVWEDETRDAIVTLHVWNIEEGTWESNPADPMDVNQHDSFSVMMVNMEIATEIEVEFREPGPQDIPPTQQLQEGWNLIGANLNVDVETEITVEEYLASVGDSYSTVTSPYMNIGEPWAVTHMTAYYEYIDGFQGYWVHMTEDATLAGRTT